ncbi:MAG: FtsX-like permease family protein [Polyangiaceae bacterium]|nr:FtsX-like permease family protein [Polyangiaceae bacterium]
MSVSERVREIGLRKALGARPGDLRAQILTEALLLSAGGGAFGAFAGVVVASLANLLISRALSTWVGVVAWGAVVAAVLVSLALGLVFGWVPAKRAAALSPVEALRR